MKPVVTDMVRDAIEAQRNLEKGYRRSYSIGDVVVDLTKSQSAEWQFNFRGGSLRAFLSIDG